MSTTENPTRENYAPADEHGDRCDDSACCPTGSILMRGDGFAHVYDLDLPEQVRKLTDHIAGAAYASEAAGDAYWIPTWLNGGEIVKLGVAAECSEFDDDDYATALVRFHKPSGDIVATLSYRIDGRA